MPKPLKKPAKQTRKSYDFSECTNFIEKKYKIDTRDYADSSGDFERWCEQVGEKPSPCPLECPDMAMKTHQAQFARYQADVAAGYFKEHPNQDFWHWLLDVADVQRGGTLELDASMGDGAKIWQKAILGLYLEEFGKGPYLTDW